MDDVIETLARDPLRNIVLLKHLEAFPEVTQAHQVRSMAGTATLVLLSTAASAYDQQTYPAAEFVVLISSDHPAATADLLLHVPRGTGLVFKLMNEGDRAVVGSVFPLQRATSFLSFTAASAFSPDANARITIRPDDATLGLFEAQGHARDWLWPLLDSGRAFASVLEREGRGAGRVFCVPEPRQRMGGRRRLHAAGVPPAGPCDTRGPHDPGGACPASPDPALSGA